MGRAFYRFGHEIALRLPNGQAFALRDAELGALFGVEDSQLCFLRGTFTVASYRGLIARGLIPPNPELQTLAQPIAVQLNLKPQLAVNVVKDAATLVHFGRRLDQNSLTDDFVRKVLMFEEWQLVSAVPYPQNVKVLRQDAQPVAIDPAQEEAIHEMVTGMADELWQAAENAGRATQSPLALTLEEAVKFFFEAEEWEWQASADATDLLRSVFEGENGRWVCYTQILPELEQVIFYSVCPIAVPTFALTTMTEYLCRVNAGLTIGNFEIDFSQNAVRFRTGVDVSGVGLAPPLFRNMVYQNLAVMDGYLSDLLGIIAGGHAAVPAA